MTIDATEQARMIRDGEASPSELVEEAIERLDRLNPQLNAVIHPPRSTRAVSLRSRCRCT